MSTSTTTPLDWLGRIGDRANPILVKETRQALKSRQFVITFMLLLAASWLISAFGMLLGGPQIEFGAVGTEFFRFYYLVLAFAVIVIVPFGAYRSLLAEREQATYELLSITTLSPRQIVWGKLLSAGVQLFILYSAITPFIAFTSLLQGFELLTVMFLLVATMLVSLLLSMLALMISSLVRHRFWQAICTTSLLVGLVGAFWITLVSTETTWDPTSTGFWWGLAVAGAVAASFFALFQQIAQSQLTFESDNRTTGIRLACSAQFALIWGGGVVMMTSGSGASTPSDWTSVISTCAVLSAVLWSAAGLFMVTEPNLLSRRIERRLPAGPLWRLLTAPLLPGGSRGYLFVLAHLLAAVGAGWWWSWVLGLTGTTLPSFVTAAACYVVIYLGMACGLGRWLGGLSPDVRPGHIRVLTLILFSIGCIGPYVPVLFGFHSSQSYTPLMIPNPLATLVHLEEDRYYAPMILPILLVAAALVLAINLLAMQRGLRRVVSADVAGNGSPIRAPTAKSLPAPPPAATPN
jgi:hypothetical protein